MRKIEVDFALPRSANDCSFSTALDTDTFQRLLVEAFQALHKTGLSITVNVGVLIKLCSVPAPPSHCRIVSITWSGPWKQAPSAAELISELSLPRDYNGYPVLAGCPIVVYMPQQTTDDARCSWLPLSDAT